MSKSKNLICLKRRHFSGFYFILPFLILLVVFKIVPIIYTFIISAMKWDIFSPPEFIGIDNYKRLFVDSVFYISILNTLLIWIINIIPRVLLALLFASILSREPKVRGKDFYMAVFYLPNLITAASMGALFWILLDWQTGSLNLWLLDIGLLKNPVNWLNSTIWARFFTALIIGWMWFGYATILLVAGMGTISNDLYESAVIDGADRFTMFRKITLPLIRPTLVYIIVTSFIGGMQNFDIPKVLTDGFGAPERSILTVVMNLYNHSFHYFNRGYGAAISVGLFILILGISMAFFKVLYKTDED